MFTAALFTIAQIWKQPKCPSVDERIKMWYIYTHKGTYSAIKKKTKNKGIGAIHNNMEGTAYRELCIANSDKERKTPYDFTCTWNLKTNEKKKKQKDL